MKQYAGKGSAGFFLRCPNGKRTRLYISMEAAARALSRGETFTDAEYQQLTEIKVDETKKSQRRRPA